MSPAQTTHFIEIMNRPYNVPAGRVKALATELLDRLNAEPSRITLAFIDDKQMRELNRQYRNKDHTTDVLSFPINDQGRDGRIYLGDVVISTERARQQSLELKHGFLTEVFQLFAHGLLHLCGHDHETDKGEMNSLELRLRTEIVDRYCR